MTRLKRLISSIFIYLFCFFVMPSQAQESAALPGNLSLQVGDVKVLAFERLARVAVGDGKILNALTNEDREVVIFAKAPGETIVHIWDRDNQGTQLRVRVFAAGERKLQQDIRQMLRRMAHVRTTTVGDKIIVEGDGISDADRERLAVLAKHFPQVVDMTSQIGWDQMVILDVQVLELPRNYLKEFGLRWGAATGGVAMGAAWERASAAMTSRPGASALDAPFRAISPIGYFGLNTLLSASVQALAQQGDAVVLAQPQLMARSGATAEFLAGGEVPYTTSDSNGQNRTVFKPYGVSLKITPRIQRNGNVRSTIEVEVSTVDNSLSLNGGPALKTRKTSTEFNVQSGQTLVLAGFISRDQFRSVDKLPGLGDIPILGALFRSRRFQNNETELAIFVRPVVVSADNADLQARVAKSRSIIEHTFGREAQLNTPLRLVTAGQRLPVDSVSDVEKLVEPMLPSRWRPVVGRPAVFVGSEVSLPGVAQ